MVRDYNGIVKALMGEWDKTSQPLKERASVLPLGQYEDGSVGLAWPGLLAAPAEGVANFGQYGYGEEAVPYNSRMAFDAAGGAMTGGLGLGLAGGMVDNAVGSAGGRLPNGMKSQLEDQLAALQKALDSGNVPKPDETLPAMRNAAATMPEAAGQGIFYRGVTRPDQPIAPVDDPTWWASSSPRVASEYAAHDGSAVFPSQARFTNPLEVDAGGASWMDVPFEGQRRVSDAIANEARSRGHDGVVFRNMVDDASMGAPSDVIAALKRGTIYSPTSGDLLYSNAPTGSSVPLAMNALERSAADLPMDLASRMARAKEMGFDTETPLYHGTQKQFEEFRPSQDGALGPGVYMTPNKSRAEHFTANKDGAQGGLLELYNRGRIATWDDIPRDASKTSWLGELFGGESPARKAADWARANGFDGFANADDVVSFDPRNIRSTSAAFDPARSDSANLLAANAKQGAAVPLAIDAAERAQPNGMKARLDMPASAAFRFGEHIVPSEFHGSALWDAAEKFGKDAINASADPVKGFEDALGFVTTEGNFLTRTQASERIRQSGLAPGEDIPDELHAATLNALRGRGLWANAPTASSVPLAVNALERAQPQGIRAYHGTNREFDYFKPSADGNVGPGVYLTGSPDEASIYTRSNLDSSLPSILPVDVRGRLAPVADYEAAYDAARGQVGSAAEARRMAAETLRGKGFDGVETSVGGVPNYTMYNPGTVYSATTGDLLYSNAKQGAAVPLALDAAERQPQGIRAYHGSPHDFDRFSLDAIGTGEGAQAYGHGLYFADSEDVARSYRDALSKQQFDPKVTQDTPELRQAAQEWLQKQGYEPAPEQIEQTVQQITQGGFAPSDFDWSKVGAEGPKGRMYEVNIRANPEDFLDWDKPLSQQSDGVKQKLGVPSPDRIAEAERLAAEIDKLNRVIDGQGGIGSPHPDVAMRMKRDLLDQYDAIDPNGSAWWKMDTKDAAARPDSAAELRKLGIPGIRYLDGMSRGAGEGSSNYVVFDDALIDILRKYANAPTGAIVPAGMEASQDDNPALIEYLKAVGLY